MAEKWILFSEPNNPWSHTPAVGYQTRNWEILFRPNFHMVSGLARARRVLRGRDIVPHSYFLMYDDGTLGWDWPERVPQGVQRAARELSHVVAETLGIEV